VDRSYERREKMRVPVYMKPRVKWREAGEAGVNGGDGKLRVGGSSPCCCLEDGQERAL
jgi:hypothetical protein